MTQKNKDGRGRSLSPSNGNDCVQTPIYLCEQIIKHFNPQGEILEPCRGEGNFYKSLQGYIQNGYTLDYCEILEGRDFLTIQGHYNWIITNPPYSKYKDFLKKSMLVADNIVFLIPLVHIWTKARLKIMRDNNFGIKEIFCVDTPKDNFPQMGFQFGCVYYKRNWFGDTKIYFA